MECTWGHNRNETHICDTTEWIIAYICDKCGTTGTIDLCHTHLSSWKDAYNTLRCTQCNGTLSWEAKNLTNGQNEWLINPGPDNDL